MMMMIRMNDPWNGWILSFFVQLVVGSTSSHVGSPTRKWLTKSLFVPWIKMANKEFGCYTPIFDHVREIKTWFVCFFGRCGRNSKVRFLLQVLHLSRCPKASLLDCRNVFFERIACGGWLRGWVRGYVLFLRTSKKWGKVWNPFNTGWWFQICFIVYPYLGKIPILTNIFGMGWNHQLE